MLPDLVENVLIWFLIGAVTFLVQFYRKLLEKRCDEGKTRKNDMSRIPGPLSLPYFGTRWIYLWRYKKTKVHEAYIDMTRRYGSVVREVFGDGNCVVNISKKEDIEKVLRFPSRFPFRPPSDIIRNYRLSRPERFASAGIAHEQGEVWQDLRSKLTPELTSRKTMLCFLPELNVIGDDFLHLLRANRTEDGNIRMFDHFASRYGLESCCTLVLGERMSFMDNEISITARQLSDAMNQRFKSERDSKYMWTLKDYTKSQEYIDFLRCEEVLYWIVSDIVDKAKNSKKDQHLDDVKCILMAIVDKPDLDEREKKSALIDFIAAGISTLSNSLIFLLYLIAKHPDVQQKVYEELEEIAPNSNHITSSDLSKMAYTKACMLEAFRLIPVAFALGRVLEEDVTLGGYNLLKGTYVTCHTMIACLDEENFKNAKQFMPERWLQDENFSKAACSFIFAPFGVGRRMCPGKRFIEQGLLVTFAKMIRDYHIEYDGELDIQFEFILSPKTPVTFRLIDRC